MQLATITSIELEANAATTTHTLQLWDGRKLAAVIPLLDKVIN